MNRRDWVLLTISAAEGRPVSPVQLQKALFLLSRNLKLGQLRTAHFYAFEAYDYGPFAREIYDDAEALEAEGFILIRQVGQPAYREYVSTPAGLQRASILRAELDDEVKDYLDRVVKWVQSMSFDQLVRAIYQAYPDTKVNSVFRG
jgi:uncharacterized phage-associated protein